jgi:hypothetical protein
MKFEVRCVKHMAKNRVWILESGKVYEAIKRNENEIDVVNHYGHIITLTLKEFHKYCEVIKQK